MRIGVLGPLEVGVGSMSRQLGSETQRMVLAALVVHAGSVVSTDRLVEIVWGEDPPPSALRSLRTYIYRLRSALEQIEPGRELIITRPPGYVLDPSALTEVDAWRHEELVSDATDPTRDPSSRLELLDQALALWRGPAYAEFAEQEFARGEALRLDESRRVAAEARCAALIDLGRHVEVIGELEALVDRDPHRERPRELLMRALYRSGRHPEALEVCNDLRTRLRDDLGLDLPPALADLELDILSQASDLEVGDSTPAGSARSGSGTTPLPPATTRLVGRDDLIRSLLAAIGAQPVVTIAGPGGVGKTRVALAVARATQASNPEPVWWCELAPVDDGGDVANVVASSLQVRPDDRSPMAALVEHLRYRSGLLVLDNCEHVVDGVSPLVRAIIAECPNITMLLTSRTVIEVAGEQVHRLEPLEVTDHGPDQPSAALELLFDRIRSTRPDLLADRLEHHQMAELCRRLDGLPLAIELAASRLRSLNPVDLLERLEHRLDLGVTGGGGSSRHRTLRTVLEWSGGLLSKTERNLFSRLSVFSGTFTLDAAEQIASDDGIGRDEVMDLLSRLVDHSLVVAVPGGGRARYVLLETVRAYGAALLDRPVAERLRRRHAAYHVSLAEELDRDVRGRAEAAAVARLDAELDNLRSAHHWAVAHDADLAMRLSAALFRYALWRLRSEVFAWAEEAAKLAEATAHPLFPTVAGMLAWGAGVRGARDESLRWVEQGLAVLDDDDPRALVPLEARMHAALWEGRLDDCLDDAALAVPLCEDPYDLVPHYVPGLALTYAGRGAEALDHLAAVEPVAEAHGNPTMCALVQYSRGEALLTLDPARAAGPLRRAAELADAVDNHVVRGVADVSLISLQARHGDDNDPEAITAYGAVIDRLYGAGDWTHLWTGLRGLVDMLDAIDHHEDAARLVGALLGADNAPPIYGEDADRLADAEARLAAALGPQRFGQLRDEGMRLSDDEAIGVARAAIARAHLAARPSAPPQNSTMVE